MTPPEPFSTTAAATRSPVVVEDLRGVRVHATTEPVLLDVSGRRAHRLRITGRVVGALFLVWFCGLILAGLGLLPAGGLPLGSVLAPATAPPTLTRAPDRRPTSRADLTPALALAGVATPRATGTGAVAPATPLRTSAATGTGRGRPAANTPGASSTTKQRPATTAPTASAGVTTGNANANGNGNGKGRPASTPAQASTPAASSPKTTAKGKSTSAPGRTKPSATPATPTGPAATTPATTTTSATAPGASGSAPGHATTTPGKGNGNGVTTP